MIRNIELRVSYSFYVVGYCFIRSLSQASEFDVHGTSGATKGAQTFVLCHKRQTDCSRKP